MCVRGDAIYCVHVQQTAYCRIQRISDTIAVLMFITKRNDVRNIIDYKGSKPSAMGDAVEFVICITHSAIIQHALLVPTTDIKERIKYNK